MNQRAIIAGVAGILIIGLGFVVLNRPESDVPLGGGPGTGDNTYSNADLGIEFRYPGKYFLTERTLNESQRLHRQVMLVEDTPENRAVIEGRSTEPREGPVAITIDFYQNNLDKQNPHQWVTGSNSSNFKLSDGAYTTTTLADAFALRYKWSGLYEGETVVSSDEEFVTAFSVTYMDPADQIVKDFEDILGTVKKI